MARARLSWLRAALRAARDALREVERSKRADQAAERRRIEERALPPIGDPDVLRIVDALSGLSSELYTGRLLEEVGPVFDRLLRETVSRAGFMESDPRAQAIIRETQGYIRSDLFKWAQGAMLAEPLARDLVGGMDTGTFGTPLYRKVAAKYGVTIYDAERNVRTTYTTAAGSTELASLKRSGYKFKTWVSSRDHRVRRKRAGRVDDHSSTGFDGQTVPVDEPFVSPTSGARMMHPGDRSLGAPGVEIYNCRCTMVGSVTADGRGELGDSSAPDETGHAANEPAPPPPPPPVVDPNRLDGARIRDELEKRLGDLDRQLAELDAESTGAWKELTRHEGEGYQEKKAAWTAAKERAADARRAANMTRYQALVDLRVLTTSKAARPVVNVRLRSSNPALPSIERGLALWANLVGDSPEVLAAIRARPVDLVFSKGRRAFYESRPDATSQAPGGYVMMGNGSAGTVVHELGHYLERVYPDVTASSIAWRNARTAGEPLVKLQTLFPGAGYDSWEVTRPDAFVHPYVGKDYGNRATEVLSMGLQRLMEDPLKFARDDPGHFDYTVSVLDRIRNGGPP